MLYVENLGRDYRRGDSVLTVLDGVALNIKEREFVAITGPSGSGKSTLLGLLAGLDRPSRGQIVVDGIDITALSEDRLSDLRARKMGFVFQSFHLIQTLTALENVRVPAELLRDAAAAARAAEWLQRVGLGDRAAHYPAQLSGGEMQRVAIARASITHPRILFADEPTGNLDSQNGQIVMDILLETNRRSTLVLVTHNPQLAALAAREIQLRDGRIHRIIEHGRRGKGAAVHSKAAARSKGIPKRSSAGRARAVKSGKSRP